MAFQLTIAHDKIFFWKASPGANVAVKKLLHFFVKIFSLARQKGSTIVERKIVKIYDRQKQSCTAIVPSFCLRLPAMVQGSNPDRIYALLHHLTDYIIPH